VRPAARRGSVVWLARASALSLAVSATLAQAQTVIDPYVEAAFGYIDNVRLAGDNEPQLDSWAFQVAPGIDLGYASPRLRAALGYRFQYLNYFSDIDENQSFHNLNANGVVQVVPDWFRISARANYGQVIEDSNGRVNYNNLFITNNQRDVFSGSITPAVNHDFGRVTAEASYSVGFVEFKGNNQGEFGSFNDSDEYRIDAGVFTSDRDQRFVWALRYSSNETRYRAVDVPILVEPGEEPPDPPTESRRFAPFKYDRAWADLSLGVSRTLSFVGEFGYESDLIGNTADGDPLNDDQIDTRDGGLDETFWSAGLRWEPDARTSVEARAGDRFFGTSYFFEARREARQLEFRALYREEPTTNNQRRAFETPLPGEDNDAQISDPFVLTEIRGTLTLDGRRSKISLDVFGIERDFLDRATDSKRSGVQLNATRDFSATMRLDVGLTTENVDEASREVERENSDFRLNRFTAELTRELGSRSEVAAVAGLNQKTGSGRQDYDGYWFGVRYRYEF
jgi:hypothetical protein